MRPADSGTAYRVTFAAGTLIDADGNPLPGEDAAAQTSEMIDRALLARADLIQADRPSDRVTSYYAITPRGAAIAAGLRFAVEKIDGDRADGHL